MKKSTAEYDSGRETRVLLEQIRSEVKVVGEQHGSIQQNISEIKTDIRSVKSEIQSVKFAVMGNSRDIKELKLGQEKIKQKLNTTVDSKEWQGNR